MSNKKLPVSHVWDPPEGVAFHSGIELPNNILFFIAPPEELGRIISVSSSLTTASRMPDGPSTMLGRLGVAVLYGGVLGIVIGGLLFLVHPPAGLFAGAFFLIFTAFIQFIKSSFGGHNSFVGEYGIMRASVSGSGKPKTKIKVAKFSEVSNLFTSEVRKYRNFVYQNTTFNFRWTHLNKTVFSMSGIYYNSEGPPPSNQAPDWHFCRSAESAWTKYQLQLANEEIDRQGYVEFPLKKNPKAVRVGKGFLEFVVSKNKTQRVAVEDMKEIDLRSGKFYFTHRDSKWWSGKGKYNFDYSEMPNAKLFWICLNQLTGISFN